MKKHDKEVVQAELNSEKAVLNKLKQNYREALDEINEKIEMLLARDDADMAHVIYQVQYQKALKVQVQGILEKLHAKEFETVSEYLAQSYDEGFIGTLYALQAQGVPLAFPINQELVAAAVQHETMLTSSLYNELGLTIKTLQKEIAAEISRGVTNALGYSAIAMNIANRSKIPMNKAMTIARTESHRIRETAAYHVQVKAAEAGADVVKIWDASLDGKTRPHHRQLDGQIRELEEPFEVAGLEAMRPGGFGVAKEDINCRCRSRCEARWVLGSNDTKMLGDVSKMDAKTKEEIAKKLGIPVNKLEQYSNQIVPINAKNYGDFKKQYKKLWRYDEQGNTERVRSSVQKINGKVANLDEYTVGGITYKVDGKHVVLDNTEHEKEVARVVGEALGKKVYMVPRVVFPQGVSTPDYIIENEKYDLKEPIGSGKHVLYNMVHKKKSQANNFVFDISNCPLDFDAITKQVEEIYSSNHTSFVNEIIIIKDGEVKKKFNREK